MKPASDNLAFRVPVWEALGELFLDNEPQLAYLIRACAESPYSLRELDQILFSEIWPALSPNLASVAGEWAGWNREWLIRTVLEKQRTASSRLWWLNPVKLYFCSPWFRIRKEIERQRSH